MMKHHILDTHVHFWDPEYLQYDWLAQVPKISQAYGPDDLVQQAGPMNLEGLVFVEADCRANQARREVEWVTRLAEEEPRIVGIVAHAPVSEGAQVRQHLDEIARFPLVKGVRQLIQSQPAGFCSQPSFVAGVKALADYELSFDICVYHHQLVDVLTLVEQCPDARLVLDHLGKPAIRSGAFEPWATHISELAQHPHMWCKLSGLITEADHANWNPAQLRPYIDHVVDCFGQERVMYGGDWPVSLLASSYQEWVETLAQALCQRSDLDLARIFAENGRSFYRIEAS